MTFTITMSHHATPCRRRRRRRRTIVLNAPRSTTLSVPLITNSVCGLALFQLVARGRTHTHRHDVPSHRIVRWEERQSSATDRGPLTIRSSRQWRRRSSFVRPFVVREGGPILCQLSSSSSLSLSLSKSTTATDRRRLPPPSGRLDLGVSLLCPVRRGDAQVQ